MKKYDKMKATAFILRRIYLEEYPSLARRELEPLVRRCIDADFAYMHAFDILSPDGSPAGCYYNKENARKHILISLIGDRPLTEGQFLDLYKLVDDYLDFNLSYLETNGLHYPSDEAL